MKESDPNDQMDNINKSIIDLEKRQTLLERELSLTKVKYSNNERVVINVCAEVIFYSNLIREAITELKNTPLEETSRRIENALAKTKRLEEATERLQEIFDVNKFGDD